MVKQKEKSGSRDSDSSSDTSEQGEAPTGSRLSLPHVDPRMYAAILAGTKTGDGRHRKDFERLLKAPNLYQRTRKLNHDLRTKKSGGTVKSDPLSFKAVFEEGIH